MSDLLTTPEWVVRVSQEELDAYEARVRAEAEEGQRFLDSLPPADYDIRLVEGMNDAEVSIEEWECHSTSEHFVHVEVDGMRNGIREGDYFELSPEQAIELGVLLIEAGRNTLRKNKK